MNTLNWKVDFWRPWREVGFLALVASEMAWVALWYNALSQITRPVSFLRIFFTLSLMLVLAHFLARLLIAIQFKIIVRRVIYAGVMLISLLVSLQWLVYAPHRFSPFGILSQTFRGFADFNAIPPDFWVILLVLLVWRRGVTLARNPIAVIPLFEAFNLGCWLCLCLVFYSWGCLPA